MYIYLIPAIFVIMLLASLFFKNIKSISAIVTLGMVVLIIITFIIGIEVNSKDYLYYINDNIYIDSFSLIQLLLISTVGFIASAYSYTYIKNEVKENVISLRKAKTYYTLFIFFVLSMFYLSTSNNIMGMWIGLEATTLSTAFLIGFNNNKLSLEAAWKYIILCSIGIAIGLVGIIFLIYASSKGNSGDSNMLLWTNMVNNYQIFDSNIAKLAFTFIFIGIGTKVGLAPMHTWLSDGHSEAPSPISAMMSGVLINLALYVVIRFYIIVKKIDGIQDLKYLFIVFGCVSLIIATFSILKQTNYKRLLAFSSVENMGIISIGIGFGGSVGVFGALLHSIVHAYGKTLLFLVSGNILSVYKSKRIDKIHGLIKTMPINAAFLLIGILVITGTPPFGLFFSEFKIISAGINDGHYIYVAIISMSLLLAFAGFLIAFIPMTFLKEKEEQELLREKRDSENILPLILSLLCILFVSGTFSTLLLPLLNKATSIIGI